MLTPENIEYIQRRTKFLQWVSVFAGLFLMPGLYLGKTAIETFWTYYTEPRAAGVEGYSLLVWLLVLGTVSTLALSAFFVFLGTESRKQVLQVLMDGSIPKELPVVTLFGRPSVRMGNALISTALGIIWLVYCILHGWSNDSGSTFLALFFLLTGCWELYSLLRKK